MTRVVFLGGPHDGKRGDLSKTPVRVLLGDAAGPKALYERVDDPDTGEFLGGYAWSDPEVVEVWTAGTSLLSSGLFLGRARP